MDLIVTNHPTCFLRIEVIPGLLDHEIVYAEINILLVRNHQKPCQIPLYSKAKWENVRNDLTDIYHTLTTTENSVNDMWNIFQIKLKESIKSNIPYKTAKQKDGCPWINRDLKRKHDRWYKCKKKSGNKNDATKYKQLKQEAQQQLSKAYWKYIQGIVTPQTDNQNANQNCMKRFWSYIKHKRSDNNNIPPLKSAGTLHSDSTKSETTKEEFKDRCNMAGNFQTMPDIQITENGVAKLLHHLNPHKSAGPDNITPRVLKELSSEASSILTLILRKSMILVMCQTYGRAHLFVLSSKKEKSLMPSSR